MIFLSIALREDRVSSEAEEQGWVLPSASRREWLKGGAAWAMAGAFPISSAAAESPSSKDMTTASDFDFLHGNWRVHHRRLARRLVGDTQWTEFDGTMRAKPILRGLGNFDENVLDLPQGRYEACTVRLFNPGTKQWSIHWIDGRDPKLDAPLSGTFTDGVGTFFGEDTFEGKPIRVRFIWSQITSRSARWEQAFSADQGRTWETNWVMRFERAADSPMTVLELRQYRMFPGKRDAMIDSFERHFIESQEEVGMRLVGQFRDLDDPDRFTWMRAFPGMSSREKALSDFYFGPVWAAHRNEVNPLMDDSDNVLLLRPAAQELAFNLAGLQRPALGVKARSELIIATIHYLWKDPGQGFSAFFQRQLMPELTVAGLPVLGAYVTEPTPNSFPRLPVRQNEKVFVWFTRAADIAAYERARKRLSSELIQQVDGYEERQAQVLRLNPTPRSLLR
jgi:NIPSNAP